MVFSKREQTMIAVTVVVLALLGLDRYVLTPLLDRYDEAKTRRETLEARMTKAQSLLQRRHILTPRWRQMLDDGLARDPAEAESQALRALQNWADQAGLDLSSLKPERLRDTTPLRRITVHAAGTGSMRAVSQFLWLVETAPIPVSVKMLQLGTRREGTDDLTLQLQLSTLYMAPQPQADPGKEGES